MATIALFLSACDSGTELVSLPPRAPTAVFSNGPVTPTLRPTATATITPTPTPSITPTPSPTAPPTPIFAGTPSAACGRLLPLVGPADDTAAGTVQITASDAAVAALQAQMPDEAWPAVQRILDAPQTVGLVAYELGNPQNGLYINAEQPMPLASVFKLITLIAYVEAVEAGELEAQTRLTLAELDRYDLPGSNVGAHERAVDEARADGRVAADDTVTLDDVAWMAVRHSSNAAADYLHDLVGQEAMEQTVRDLELGTHTAPCPFLAQFLAIHHENRPGADITAVRAYLADPQAYAADGRRLADGFVNNADFRAQQGRWRADLQAQRLFADQLSPQASAADYAAVMARLAQNGLSSPDSSFHARKMIEWPMRFPVNQQLFTNLGYKDGLLPGVLTTAYYAYPADGRPPMVVVLFYRQLPHRTYQQWRYRLPHDAFARWLLTEPQGLRLVRGVLGK